MHRHTHSTHAELFGHFCFCGLKCTCLIIGLVVSGLPREMLSSETSYVSVCVCVLLWVCMCVRGRERELESMCVGLCVCERESVRERERERKKERMFIYLIESCECVREI